MTAAEMQAVWPGPGLVIARQTSRGGRRQVASEWIARLALAGPLQVLDGGNVFDAYRVARLVRSQTHELEAAMGGIIVRRAFTCYQMAALLADTVRRGERRLGERRLGECRLGECRSGERRLPLPPQPVVVLELLATFADENVPTRERERLFEQCLADLKCLGCQAPVLVSVTCPADDGPNDVHLFGFDQLVEAAGPGPDGELLRLSPDFVRPDTLRPELARPPLPGQPTQLSLWTGPGGS